MFRRVRFAARGILVASLVTALAGLVAGGAAASPARQTQGNLDHLRRLSGQQFEVEWMSMMIQHHQVAVEMAQLAETRTRHQEIKTVAQNIIKDQTNEIGEMTAWLKQWYNADPMTGMMHEGKQTGPVSHSTEESPGAHILRLSSVGDRKGFGTDIRVCDLGIRCLRSIQSHPNAVNRVPDT